MEALLGSVLVAFFVAWVALLPKGSEFSKQQFENTQKEVDNIIKARS